MSRRSIRVPIIVIVIILVAIVLSTVFMYNGLVKAEKRVEEAKAQVEVVCQRRLDLIPNLVEIVKGYAEHEKETLTAVTAARNKVQDVLEGMAEVKTINKEQMTELASSESQLSGSLTTLFALVENYPNLKASMNFLTLQDQLEGTENRISVTRQRYNSLVRFYNTKTAKFPSNIIAGMFGFKEKEFFQAVEETQRAGKIEF